MEGLAVPFKILQEFLKNIIDFFSDLLSYLNPFHENFIFRGFFSGFFELLSYLNPFSENFFVYKLIQLLGDLLEWLFIPQNNPFSELSEKFNEKFAFIKQIQQLFSGLLGYNNYGNSSPTFNMTWKGVQFDFIDFSMFINYRVWLHGIILAISWFIFIRRTFNKLPSIVGGFGQ